MYQICYTRTIFEQKTPTLILKKETGTRAGSRTRVLKLKNLQPSYLDHRDAPYGCNGDSKVIGVGGKKCNKKIAKRKITDPSRKKRLQMYWKPSNIYFIARSGVLSTERITECRETAERSNQRCPFSPICWAVPR